MKTGEVKKISIVFLYTELAGYTLACLRELAKQVDRITVFRYPVNNEAPFHFELPEGISFINSRELSRDELEREVEKANPSLVICSGWIDRNYLSVCKKYKGKIPTVLALDTHWRGDLKQVIALFMSPFFIKNRFSHAWVPGDIQKKYALKLGFDDAKISKGFYCADTKHFNTLREKFESGKNAAFPKRFIYVGRYYEFKGIKDLWKAFIELQEEQPNEWELWCLGTGDIEPVIHPKIKHLGFVQPSEMEKFIGETGVFVLPSHFEPWAVAVHEFACCGFPVICSTAVGAAVQFVVEGENGYLFPAGNAEALKERLKQITTLPQESLNLMSRKSKELAGTITLKDWTETALKIATQK